MHDNIPEKKQKEGEWLSRLKQETAKELGINFIGGFGALMHKGSTRAEECLLEAMATWGLPADEIIYVGDAPTDIDHCRRVGVRIINAAWASTTTAEAAACTALNPEYRLNHFNELLPLILSL